MLPHLLQKITTEFHFYNDFLSHFVAELKERFISSLLNGVGYCICCLVNAVRAKMTMVRYLRIYW